MYKSITVIFYVSLANDASNKKTRTHQMILVFMLQFNLGTSRNIYSSICVDWCVGIDMTIYCRKCKFEITVLMHPHLLSLKLNQKHRQMRYLAEHQPMFPPVHLHHPAHLLGLHLSGPNQKHPNHLELSIP